MEQCKQTSSSDYVLVHKSKVIMSEVFLITLPSSVRKIACSKKFADFDKLQSDFVNLAYTPITSLGLILHFELFEVILIKAEDDPNCLQRKRLLEHYPVIICNDVKFTGR
ncbi:hypothetical protein KC19_8G085400 [Ceratodon purpureus]|uniref:Uncharacterized protein n=1 Tax=Ceratodon purpureus TaxID=3225 RepID=A0A8T0H211_CERPU|nr:hypothetical protein KC19_8G085400 [Ceratodon purpureus]